MLLSIIIIQYNAPSFTEQCLCSVEAACKDLDVEVLVVDNASTTGHADYLTKRFPFIQLVLNTRNTGFAKANNQALQIAKGKYVLFLNPDTLLPENALQNCITFFERNEHAGAIGLRMIDGSGRFLPESKRAFPSPLVSLYKLVGLAAIFPRSSLFNKYALGNLPDDGIHAVDVLSGACMMVRKTLLDSTGGFDEQFFMYAEDIDLSYRLQQQGFTNYYLGNTTIIHFKGESTQKQNLRYIRLFYTAMLLFVRKHYTGLSTLLLQIILQLTITVKSLFFWVMQPFRQVSSLFKQKKKSIAKTFALVGDVTGIQEAIHIIQQQCFVTHHTRMLQPHDLLVPSKIAEEETVFCCGSFTYLEAIALLQQATKSRPVKWHGLCTQSIVGSAHKSTSGEVYVAVQP